MKIKISTIHAVLVYLLVFFSTTYISYNPIRYFLLVVVAMMIAPNIKILSNNTYRGLNVGIDFFCIATLIVSYINRNGYTDRNPFLAAIVFTATLVEFTLTVEIFCQREEMQNLIKVFYRMTLLVVIATDCLILFTTIHLQYGGDVFLVGTKFSVIYMHFYLISFFIADKNVRLRTIRKSSLNNAILVLFFIMTMIMSIELGTATGIVGTVALLLFLWLNEKNIGFFLNSKSFFVALLASLLFAVFVEIILSNSVVTYIITQLLGKDVTLTFRTVIYSMLPNIMKGRWLWGFGYGTGYEVLMRHGIVDAQNGVFDWIQQIGIFGTMLLVMWLCIAMKRPKNDYKINYSDVRALTALIYVFVLLATVEITFSSDFLAAVVLLYGIKMQRIQEGEMLK